MASLISPFSAIFIGVVLGLASCDTVRNVLNKLVENNCTTKIETVQVGGNELKHCVRNNAQQTQPKRMVTLYNL
jgi:hypothetical protein